MSGIDDNSTMLQTASAQESSQNKGLLPPLLRNLNMTQLIQACNFPTPPESVTTVYYPADKLFKVGKKDGEGAGEDEPEDTDQSQDEGA
jgi:hypothetical protein